MGYMGFYFGIFANNGKFLYPLCVGGGAWGQGGGEVDVYLWIICWGCSIGVHGGWVACNLDCFAGFVVDLKTRFPWFLLFYGEGSLRGVCLVGQ